jgi:acetyl-CoA C-acetyltransferase
MPNSKVYIIGGYQTDFALNYPRQGKTIVDLIKDTVMGGLLQTGIEPHEIQTSHIGNFIGELTVNQGHLGGFMGEIHPSLIGKPAARHEAACASGGIALLAASAEIEAGRYDLACVLGVELEKSVSGDETAKYLGVAAWVEQECNTVKYPWPKLFSDIGEEYNRRYGLQYEHLAQIAQNHFNNAKFNPNAQTRNWQLNEANFSQDNYLNPIIEGMIRKQDCSQVTDGGAVVFLASETYAQEYTKRKGLKMSDLPYIKGWGHRTAQMALADKLKTSQTSPYLFPHVRGAVQDALHRAQMNSIFQVDCVETHDCFTTSAYMAIDHLGITEPGKNWQAIEEGIIEKTGKLPLNPSGGLIGLGHPVGATGVRMVLDAYKQTTGQAADYQVDKAKNVATLNIGGSTTTTVSFVIGVD